MKSSKKALISSFSFLLCLFIMSIIIYEPFANSEIYSYCDSKLRKSLEGELDFLIIGSSPGYRAFNTKIYDDTMNRCCYNASGAYMPWTGRKALLEEEINRQPLKTVVIEISYDSLLKDVHSSPLVEGHMYIQPRLSSLLKRLSYFWENVTFGTFEKYYTNLMQNGTTYFYTQFKKILGNSVSTHNVDYALKGYAPYPDDLFNNLSIEQEDAASVKGIHSINVAFRDDNMETLTEMIQMCRSKNIDVFLVVTTCSGSSVWAYGNADVFYDKLSSFAKDNGCIFLDFNLLRNRFDIFSDETDWVDSQHMSKNGSKVFSQISAEVFKKYYDGENIQSYFFQNYADMLVYSPYALSQ